MHGFSRLPLQLYNSNTKPAWSSSTGRVAKSGSKPSARVPKPTHSSGHRRRDASGSDSDVPAWTSTNRRSIRQQRTNINSQDAESSSSRLPHGSSSSPAGSTVSAAAQQQSSIVRQQQQQRSRSTISSSPDSSISSRKNPELYSLTSSATQQQQQYDAGVSPVLPSISGTVGSTGSFGAAVQPSVAGGSSSSSSTASVINTTSSDQHHHRQIPKSPTTTTTTTTAAAAAAVIPTTKPEVLSPAGGWPQLRAAVENGADAVYFGVTGFNARARAANFSPDELPEVMSFLHLRGVKGYVALNILIFDDELPAVEALIRQLALSGVDAVIVQDVGVVALIKRVAPELHIHGSTQMSITSAQGAEFAAGLGVSRVVVGRELSITEISQVKSGSSSSSSVEIEAFCHGALCVSYSGQCYSSEAWGGRSANRGQCAQACRMPYGLIVDGQLKVLSDESYLLSPQDLMSVDQIPAMIRAGVGCFKIEGRLKGPEYVAITTAAYRKAVDAAWEQVMQDQHQQQQQDPSSSSSVLDPTMLSDLAQMFSRGQDERYNGLTPGFLEGPNHQRLVRGRAPRHRGLCLGRVTSVTNRGVVIEGLVNPVKRGDGVVIDQGRPEDDEQGGAVWDLFEVQQQQQWQQQQQQRRVVSGRGSSSSSRRKIDGEAAAGSCVELVFGPGQVNTYAVSAGDLVWKTRDPALESRLRATYEGVSSTSARKLPVKVSISGSLGHPLTVTLSDNDGHIVSADTGDVVLQPAANRAMTKDDVISAVGQLGNNVLMPTNIDTSELALDQGLFLPASAFKSVRRDAANKMLSIRTQHNVDQDMAQQPVLPQLLAAAAAAARPSSSSAVVEPRIRVLCRSAAQVSAAAAVPWLDEIIVDFLEVHGLREAVAAVKAAGKRVVVAMPRIIKPGESRLLWFYLKLGADALLLRGAGCLQQLIQLGGTGATVHSITQLNSSSSSSSSNAEGDRTLDDAVNQSPAAAAAAAPGSSAAAVPGAVTIPDLEGDFSLNASNVLSADLLLRSGLRRLCLTHDLNADQLAAVAEGLGPVRAQQLEMICHQHLPIFHTEHCVFCRFLSGGNSYLDCGHPCEQHKLQLRDHAGADHLVLADMGCRNTVFNASAQSGLYYLPRLVSSGFTSFRIELVDEQPELVTDLLECYKSVLDDKRRVSDMSRWLKRVSNGGVSSGSLEVRQERTAAELRPTARRQ